GTNNQPRLESAAGNNKRVFVARPSANEVNHFKFVSLVNGNGLPFLLGHNRPVALDSYGVLGKIKMFEKLGDAQRRRQFLGFAIQTNLNFHMSVMLARPCRSQHPSTAYCEWSST